jgi:hypothetical protein
MKDAKRMGRLEVVVVVVRSLFLLALDYNLEYCYQREIQVKLLTMPPLGFVLLLSRMFRVVGGKVFVWDKNRNVSFVRGSWGRSSLNIDHRPQ